MSAGDKDELPDAKTAEGRQSEEQELAERSHRGRERLGMALRGDGGATTPVRREAARVASEGMMDRRGASQVDNRYGGGEGTP